MILLKPCPFCGCEKPEVIFTGSIPSRRNSRPMEHLGSVFVACPKCWSRGTKKHRLKGLDIEVQKEAEEAWNMRLEDIKYKTMWATLKQVIVKNFKRSSLAQTYEHEYTKGCNEAIADVRTLMEDLERDE